MWRRGGGALCESGDIEPAEHACAPFLTACFRNSRSAGKLLGFAPVRSHGRNLACGDIDKVGDAAPPAPPVGPWAPRRRSGHGQPAPRGVAAGLGVVEVGMGRARAEG